jgi:hypothetical protein
MTNSAGQWPPKHIRLASDDQLIPFGQITLGYNLLESTIHDIFCVCAPLDRGFARGLLGKLNNRDLIDLLSALVKNNEKDPDVRDAILHCLLCYDICTENRNILMHIEIETVSESMFQKRSRNNPTQFIKFDIEVSELRLIGEQIANVFVYAFRIWDFLTWDDPNSPRALPEKLPKPRKLTPYQPQKLVPGEKPASEQSV